MTNAVESRYVGLLCRTRIAGRVVVCVSSKTDQTNNEPRGRAPRAETLMGASVMVLTLQEARASSASSRVS